MHPYFEIDCWIMQVLFRHIRLLDFLTVKNKTLLQWRIVIMQQYFTSIHRIYKKRFTTLHSKYLHCSLDSLNLDYLSVSKGSIFKDIKQSLWMKKQTTFLKCGYMLWRSKKIYILFFHFKYVTEFWVKHFLLLQNCQNKFRKPPHILSQATNIWNKQNMECLYACWLSMWFAGSTWKITSPLLISFPSLTVARKSQHTSY